MQRVGVEIEINKRQRLKKCFLLFFLPRNTCQSPFHWVPTPRHSLGRLPQAVMPYHTCMSFRDDFCFFEQDRKPSLERVVSIGENAAGLLLSLGHVAVQLPLHLDVPRIKASDVADKIQLSPILLRVGIYAHCGLRWKRRKSEQR